MWQASSQRERGRQSALLCGKLAHDEKVELSPAGVFQELLDQSVLPYATPDHCVVTVRQHERNGHHAEIVLTERAKGQQNQAKPGEKERERSEKRDLPGRRRAASPCSTAMTSNLSEKIESSRATEDCLCTVVPGGSPHRPARACAGCCDRKQSVRKNLRKHKQRPLACVLTTGRRYQRQAGRPDSPAQPARTRAARRSWTSLRRPSRRARG